MTLYQRLAHRIARLSALCPVSGCHLWMGAVNNDGYARINYRDNGQHRQALVHRIVMDAPRNREVDHLCGVRCCVNPAHLMLVTHRENCSSRENRRRFQWRNYTAEIL